MKNILFLTSGNGGNFKFLHQAIKNNLISDISVSMVSDRDCGANAYAKSMDIENCIIPYTRNEPSLFQRVLKEKNPDFIVTNWHQIIDAKTVSQNRGKLINLHYSLLPAFAGLIGIEPIKKAYEQGCKFIGPTCHLVDEGVDTGEILAQGVFKADRPFKELVTMMFRSGCLVLLNALLLSTSHRKEFEASKTILFSPELTFDKSCFDEKFWQKVASS